MNTDRKKGFALTASTILVSIFMATLIPSFSSLSFFTVKMAKTDGLIYQAYYNMNSGAEYAQFIINHAAVYDPLDPTGGSGKSPWPKGTNGATGASFWCSDDPYRGKSIVGIADDGGGGYNITAQGAVPKTKNMSVADWDNPDCWILTKPYVVHLTGGKVQSWQ